MRGGAKDGQDDDHDHDHDHDHGNGDARASFLIGEVMGMFGFIKEAGEKLFGRRAVKAAQEATAPTPEGVAALSTTAIRESPGADCQQRKIQRNPLKSTPWSRKRLLPLVAAVGAVFALSGVPAQASSHREAPFISAYPKVDGADYYMFRSYESGRSGYVTMVATYNPLQGPGGAPNYYFMEPNGLYEIHIDNNGDGKEDITFQFRFTNTTPDNKLNIGGKQVSIPLIINGSGDVATINSAALNLRENFTVNVVRGDRRSGTSSAVTNAAGGSATFEKPVDNIGNKTISDYPGYAAKHVYDINIPGCAGTSRMFVGQRKDPFQVNLGEIFDLFNIPAARILGSPSGGQSSNAKLNITALELEVPISCLTAGAETVIGSWTTASLRQGRLLNGSPGNGLNKSSKEGGPWVQVSRLGMPLVNEVVIGLPDKDKFNASKPKDDAQFIDYVTNPTFPALVETLYASAGVKAPTLFPRNDLVAVFLTGVTGVNKPANVAGSEMLRLNTALPATPAGSQNYLGAAQCFISGILTLTNPGCDPAGFPNGRRPGDDIVDIVVRVAMGYLLPLSNAPSGQLAYTDGALNNESQFDTTFPYLKSPLPGSPNGLNNLPPNPGP